MKKTILIVTAIQFAESFQICVLLPFVPFMVAGFKEVPPDLVGVYSGMIASAFPFGQFLSSFVFGTISDRFGEKIVVLISLGLTCIMSTLFGVSQSFGFALACRFIGGLTNGNIGVIKTYIGKKATNSLEQTKAMSLISAAWVIGTIIAPAIGGLLSNPNEAYPSVFKSEFFEVFPYSLPCFIASFIVAFSWLVSLLFMDDPKFENLVHKMTCRKSKSYEMVELEEADDNDINDNSSAQIENESQDIGNNKPKNQNQNQNQNQDQDQDQNESLQQQEKEQTFNSKEMYFCSVMYGLISLLFISLDEVFPLFCRGVLLFESKDIGIALSIMAIINIVYIIFCFPLISKRFDQMVIFFFFFFLFFFFF